MFEKFALREDLDRGVTVVAVSIDDPHNRADVERIAANASFRSGCRPKRAKTVFQLPAPCR